MPFPQIDPVRLRVYPVESRKSKSRLEAVAVDAEAPPPAMSVPVAAAVAEIVQRIRHARKQGAPVMLAFGAHLIKNGLAPVLIRLMEKGWITHLATQGAGTIHDWEFAYMGRSEEDVRANVETGSFGTWEETGKYINLAVQTGALENMGYGESVGHLIQNDGLDIPDADTLRRRIAGGLEGDLASVPALAELLQTVKKFNLAPGRLTVVHPFKRFSYLAAACRLRVPVTVHPGIGYDIIYNHPFANGAALGRGAHTDFKIFVHSVSRLSEGVFLSVGSAIMAPQVFEKALSQANNLALQQGEKIHDHYIHVVDLQDSVWDWSQGEPPKSSPDYYLRFLKSFYRMGGTVRYTAADNRVLLHNLYAALK